MEVYLHRQQVSAIIGEPHRRRWIAIRRGNPGPTPAVRLIFPHLSPLCNPQPVYELSLIGVEVEGQQAPEREELVMSCLEPRNLERAHVGDSGPRHIDETLPI